MSRLSFDDLTVIASGGIAAPDYPMSAQGRAAVKQFLELPLEPAENETGFGNVTTYVYVDPALKPLRNGSAIRVSGFLEVKLTHNKVNASLEDRRLFEYHNYVFNETIPGGVTCYVPVKVHYFRCSGLNNCISRP
ncbi:MAG: hypothetical protein A4E28_01963 [Methanocella sp. PtaU1.Bin125]|nr:MAG: hypothetical protein A4E28_01963 [Methanocella sp. PtaU1.Bin125]